MLSWSGESATGVFAEWTCGAREWVPGPSGCVTVQQRVPCWFGLAKRQAVLIPLNTGLKGEYSV